jgi:two-component sensor histidine kinase
VSVSRLRSENTSLSAEESSRLSELISEWQLLADISFADLVLWIPKRKDQQSWPEGHRAIAQIRPMTAATVFTQDLIGQEIAWGSRPHIDHALSTGEIERDSESVKLGDFTIKEETIPVLFSGKIIAVISRYRNVETMRQPSRLELNYREIANHIYRMIAEGNFPVQEGVYLAEAAPRVGDGLVRLDVDGRITFASPNARSAFIQIGWRKDMDGINLGEILDSLTESSFQREPREENWRVSMSGRNLRREEFENSAGVVDLLSIPLTAGNQRIGAVVLVHNVTELRRKDRALVSKDATIREIHHRVKNNLQAVSALLRLQARRVDDPSASAAIEEAVRRVASIAIVHETLSTNAKESVFFDEVIAKIMTNALELSQRSGEVSIEKIGEFGEVPSILATPLALVLTELIHNALEHGLAQIGSRVQLQVTRTPELMSVSVSDNGAGVPEDFSIEKNMNLGLQIVKTLTENELSGVINFQKREPGTLVEIKFPLM